MNKKTALYFIIGLTLIGTKALADLPLNKIVAIVNGDVITKSELDRKTAIVEQQLKSSNADLPPTPKLKQQILNNLIDNSLQLQLAKRNNIQLSKKELDNIIANIAKSNGLTLEKLQQSLLEREGIKFNEFINQIRDQVLITRVEQQFLGGGIKVSATEVQAEMKKEPTLNPQTQYHLVDLLFSTPEAPNEKQLQTAVDLTKKIAIQLKSEMALEKVVAKYQPQLQEGSLQTEDLGWRKISELPSLFAKEVAKMKVNQVVGPLQAPNGLHLIKLLGVNSQTQKLTKEQAYERVYQRKLMEKLTPWLKELREMAYIKIFN